MAANSTLSCSQVRGFLRLELGNRIRSRLQAPEFLPAGGQGAVGIECRSDDAELQALLAPLGCSVTTACVSAERRVSARLGGNCSVPLAAYCVEEGDGYWLAGPGRRSQRCAGPSR